ncbi:hypothetical protein J4Q44_G00330520, partial [Coregonus suidteri]
MNSFWIYTIWIPAFFFFFGFQGKWKSSLNLCVCQRGNGGTLSSWVFRDFSKGTVRQQLLTVLSTQHYMMFLLFDF